MQAHAAHLAFARFDDEVLVRTRVASIMSIGTRSIQFEY